MPNPPSSQTRIGPWLVVVFCFLALALAFSMRAALGLVMPVWERELHWTKSFISGAGATALIVMACVAPFAGRFVDRFGARLTLTAGLLAVGIGAGIVAIGSSQTLFLIGFSLFGALGFGIVATHVVSTAVARLFVEGRGLAMGVATSGSTAGQFVILPLIAYVLSYASWRWSFGALAIACMMLIPILWRLLGSPAASQRGGHAGHASNLRADAGFILKSPAFHALFWSFLLCGYTTTGIIETHLIPYSAFCGFSPQLGATAYGFLSAINFGGMILAGWLTDRVHRPSLLVGIYLIRAVTFVVLMHVETNYETLLMFAAVFGVVDYSTVPITASLAASYLGIQRMGLAMGLISAGHAAGGALGAFLGGYLFDLTASYILVWQTGIWLAAVAAFIVLPLGDRRAQAVPA